MIKFNSILKFIIHFSTIYINPMFTDYLIKVVCEFGVETLSFELTLIKCCWVAKSKINSFTKPVLETQKVDIQKHCCISVFFNLLSLKRRFHQHFTQSLFGAPPVAPKSLRLQSSSQYLFTHLGSTSVTAVR
jgi:hypothetical protein